MPAEKRWASTSQIVASSRHDASLRGVNRSRNGSKIKRSRQASRSHHRATQRNDSSKKRADFIDECLEKQACLTGATSPNMTTVRSSANDEARLKKGGEGMRRKSTTKGKKAAAAAASATSSDAASKTGHTHKAESEAPERPSRSHVIRDGTTVANPISTAERPVLSRSKSAISPSRGRRKSSATPVQVTFAEVDQERSSVPAHVPRMSRQSSTQSIEPDSRHSTEQRRSLLSFSSLFAPFFATRTEPSVHNTAESTRSSRRPSHTSRRQSTSSVYEANKTTSSRTPSQSTTTRSSIVGTSGSRTSSRMRRTSNSALPPATSTATSSTASRRRSSLHSSSRPTPSASRPSSASTSASQAISSTKSTTTKAQRTFECLTCCETLPRSKIQTLPCSHHWCNDCLRHIFKASITDPTQMPPKCCNSDRSIDPVPLGKLFDYEFKKKWNRKYAEYTTKNRVYCPRKGCGDWIKPSHFHTDRSSGRKYAQCTKCKTKACVTCSEKYHPKEKECPKDPSLKEFLDMGEEKGWKRCYNCKAMVELGKGCNHMTCRCGAEFCMVCGVKWKGCECTLFSDEAVAMDREEHDRNPWAGMGLGGNLGANLFDAIFAGGGWFAETDGDDGHAMADGARPPADQAVDQPLHNHRQRARARPRMRPNSPPAHLEDEAVVAAERAAMHATFEQWNLNEPYDGPPERGVQERAPFHAHADSDDDWPQPFLHRANSILRGQATAENNRAADELVEELRQARRRQARARALREALSQPHAQINVMEYLAPEEDARHVLWEEER